MSNEELMRQVNVGNLEAAEQLYKNNMGLIRSIAKECAAEFGYLQGEKDPAYTEELLQDLCAEGTLTFYDRIQSGEYDPEKGRLTTYLYPYIKGAMRRWLEQQAHYQERTISMDDLAENEDGDQLEFQMADQNTFRPEIVVYRKICVELLSELFNSLSAKDRSILGHTYGVYGYPKRTTDELALKELLTVDGVVKARKTALRHFREKYEGSRLQIWRRVYRLVMKA